MQFRRILALFVALGCAPGEIGVEALHAPSDAVPPLDATDAAPPLPPDAPPPLPPDAPPPPRPWSDREKCEHMCQAYCVQKHMCDGSSIEQCRMAIDEADGGTCAERAPMFADIPQSKIEACIAAIKAMSCPDFLRMYNWGTGAPTECKGILF